MQQPIEFLNPRHPYAHEEGDGPGHVYMPTSLLTATARARVAGADILGVADENLRPFEPRTDLIGINLIGVPFIPRIRERMTRFGNDVRAIFGGQIVNGLTKSEGPGSQKQICDRRQFDQVFGKQHIVGNSDTDFAKALGIDVAAMPSPAHTSLIPAYDLLSGEDMKEYLSHEFAFYLSQGCAFHCKFCAAVRSKKNPLTGKWERVAEEYRDAHILKQDLTHLSQKALDFGLPKLDLYLTNLDLFQTPGKLNEFADIAKDVTDSARETNPEFRINMRGLATVSSFMKLHKKRPDIIQKLVAAGLHTVGFGIDGWDEETWRRIHKGHNSKKHSIQTMKLCREEYDITPEVLMVFGHREDSQESLDAAYNITEHMVHIYGATPRPHVSKDLSPGNEYWDAKDSVTRRRVKFLLENPDYFQHFDYTCEASSVTHLNDALREQINRNFLKMTQLPGSTTHYIRAEIDRITRLLNLGKFDR